MIEISGVSKSYGKQKVLSDFSVTASEGEAIALIGPNGSGKTTLIKSILGLVLPETGNIEVMGSDIRESSSYHNNIGYMPQINRFPEGMTVSGLFDLIKKIRGSSDPASFDLDLYSKLDIEKMKSRALGNLSGGMQQKVSASLAFLFNPPILILDEPTAGLDPVSNEAFKEKIRFSRESGKLVVITSHILSELDEVSDRIVYLMDGRLLFDKKLDQLKAETSEDRLNKIIVKILEKKEL